MVGTFKVPTISGRPKQQILSQEIGTLLSSYTKAINKRFGRKDSLFRSKTKAKNGWIDDFVTLDGPYKELFFKPENDYAATRLKLDTKVLVSQRKIYIL